MASRLAQEEDRMNVLHRELELDATQCREDTRTVAASLSSTYAVERGYGQEVLLHGRDNVDLAREPLPLLVGHGTDQLPIGTVSDLTLTGDKLRGVLRFGLSARAQEVWNDVKAGVLRSLSIGYQILHGTQRGEQYVVDRWQPLEVSIVSVPADPHVGIGRSFYHSQTKGTTTMEQTTTNEQWSLEEKSERRAKAERGLVIAELWAIGEKFQCEDLARKAIRDGWSVSELKEAVMASRGKAKPVIESAAIGLSDREADAFSLTRAIVAMERGDWSLAPFEKEASDAVAQRLRRPAQGVFVPLDVQRRTLLKSTNSAGGYTVATETMGGNMVELLRNASLVKQLGATVLGGLVGDVAIPKATGGASMYWVPEDTAPTASTPVLGQIALTPKTVGGYTDISRKLLLQSSIDVEAFVRRDLALGLGVELDRVCITGNSNSGEPLGILNVSGIGAVVGGDNGLAPAWAHVVDLESEVAVDNANVGSLAYLTNAKVRGKLKKTLKNSASGSDYIWPDTRETDGFGTLNGYRVGVSNNVPSTLTKGNSSVCSALIYGDFASLLIGEWGTLDLLVDPYTHSASGTVRVRILQDVDVAVRHAESFAAMKDALTA